MHKLRNGSQVTVRPSRKAVSGVAGYFSESNDSGAPSYPGQDWFNDVIDEFLNAIQAMGITYDTSRLDNLALAFSNASGAVHNLFAANQNFNVPGSDGELTSSNQTFLVGSEFTFGWQVVGSSSLVDVSLVDGVLSATSGVIQRSYPKDPAGFISAATVYGSVFSSVGAGGDNGGGEDGGEEGWVVYCFFIILFSYVCLCVHHVLSLGIVNLSLYLPIN